MRKIISFILTILMFLFPSLNLSRIHPEKDTWETDYPYVYVHGLYGWGSYDLRNRFLPYWGLLGGDMIRNLNKRGYTCRSASVDPVGSAWDRACELYAQLAGTRVDYGKAHSEKYGHARYGRDYSEKRLIDTWSARDKVNLLGHSFGGTTIRVLSELMANGSADERRATDKAEISPLFTGGKADWIYSITTLASPTNGTTAYGFGDPDKELPTADCAAYDMYIDSAMALNETISTQTCIYYFAIPCSVTVPAADGTQTPDVKLCERSQLASAKLLGTLTGVTPKGYVVDASWLENDGSVNTISAGAPFNAPSVRLDRTNIRPGVWNVDETHRGDHMVLIGDLWKSKNVRTFYADWMEMINRL